MRSTNTIIDLIALTLLSASVQWCVCQASWVPAADCVRHVAFAQSIEEDGLLSVIRRYADQPGFAALVAGTHHRLPPRERISPTAWLRSAQLVASLGTILACIPTYLLLRDWLGRRKALVGGILFIALPQMARLGADGLADSWGLLFCLIAFACLLRPLARRRAQICGLLGASASLPLNRYFFLAGIAVGLSLFVESEALLLIPAVGLFVVITPSITSPTRRRWSTLAAFLGGTLFILGPYAALVGAHSPATLSARLLGNHQADSDSIMNRQTHVADNDGSRWTTPSGAELSFARKDFSTTTRRFGLLAAVQLYAQELGKLTHYWFALLAAWGCWKMHRAKNCLPGRLLFFVAAIYSVFIVLYVARVGYLSTRHLLPLTPILIGWSTQGLSSVSRMLSQMVSRWRMQAGLSIEPWPARTTWRVLSVVGIAALLPVALAPLHAHHAGHRLAGEWLAAHAAPTANIFDTQGWTALYSGHQTYRAEAGNAAVASPALRYVVVEQRELLTNSPRANTLREILNLSANRLATFSPAGRPTTETVLLYAWNAERFATHFSRQERQH